jgi:hypothetical protein
VICIIAGNYREAEQFARSQSLDKDEWFYPADVDSLSNKNNFHVIVIGTAGENVPEHYFDKIWSVAKERGKRNRI